MLERAKRGGMTFCSKRLARANNKYMESFDNNKPSKYLMYQDCNNLYGWAMIQHLPHSDFKWENPEIYTEEYIMNIKHNSDRGCFLDVDLEYPKELHNSHNDFPLAPYNRAIQENELSDYQRKMKSDIQIIGGDPKLISTLEDRKNTFYIIEIYNYTFTWYEIIKSS